MVGINHIINLTPRQNKYTQKEIRVVQRLIERCLTFYLTREEAISTLYSYEPHFVRLGIQLNKKLISSLAKT